MTVRLIAQDAERYACRSSLIAKKCDGLIGIITKAFPSYILRCHLQNHVRYTPLDRKMIWPKMIIREFFATVRIPSDTMCFTLQKLLK